MGHDDGGEGEEAGNNQTGGEKEGKNEPSGENVVVDES